MTSKKNFRPVMIALSGKRLGNYSFPGFSETTMMNASYIDMERVHHGFIEKADQPPALE